MAYLEYLRVRRVFIWFAILEGIGFCMTWISARFAPFSLGPIHANYGIAHASTHPNAFLPIGPMYVPADALFAFATTTALVFSTTFAGSLNRETAHAHFAWVRPLSRLRTSALVICVDIAAIVAATALTFVLAVVTFYVSAHGPVYVVATISGALALFLGLGCAVAWYSLLQAASAWTKGSGGMLVGVAAACLLLAPPLSHSNFLGPFAYVVRAVVHIDPLTYYGHVAGRPSFLRASAAAGTVDRSTFERIGAVWCIAAVALGIAVASWKRLEV